MNQILRSPLLWLGLGAFWGLMPQDAFAQVGIGTRTPDPSAMLEIRSTNKGLLIPRVALTGPTDATTVPSPASSLLVFNTNTALPGGTGFYYNDGSPATPQWVRFVSSSAPTGLQFWSVTGNAGTNPAVNFLGTTDAQDQSFRVNSVERMRLYQNGGLGLGNTVSQNLQLGFGAAGANPTGISNTSIGINAGTALTSGNQNTFLGAEAGRLTSSGEENTFVGRQAGQSNVSGIRSTYLGASAGPNSTGSNNTFLGYGAGLNNSIGSGNTAVGLNAGSTSTNGTNNTYLGAGANSIVGALSNATAIGAGSLVGSDNTISLGNGVVRVGIGTLTAVPAKTLHIVGGARITELGGTTIGTGGDRIVVADNNGDLSTRPLPGVVGPNDFIQNGLSPAQNANFNIGGTGTIGGRITAGQATITGLGGNGDRIVVTDNFGNLTSQQAPAAGIFNQTTVQNGASFNVGGSGQVGTTLGVGGNTTVGGTLGVAGATTVGGTLGVSGATTLGSTLNAGATTLASARVNNLGGAGTRLVTTDNNGNLATQAIPAPIDAILNQNAADQNANFRISGSGQLGTNLTVAGNSALAGNLNVTGLTTLTNLAGTGNRQVVAGPTGQLTTQPIPAAMDAILNNATTTAAGAQTASFNVSGNGRIGGDATINGTTTTNSLAVNQGASVGNSLTVGNNLSVGGNEFVSGNSAVAGTFAVNGNTTLGNTFGGTVTAASLAGTGTRQVVADANGLLSTQPVPGAGILDQNAVNQNANFRISGSGQVGSLTVNNAATVGTSLAVGTSATVGTTLNTGGLATLNSAAITNNAAVGGTLNVTGATTLASLNGTGTRLVVAGPTGQLSTQAVPPAGINNQTTQQTGANFNIDGSGTVGTALAVGTSATVGTTLTTGGQATLNSLNVTNTSALNGATTVGTVGTPTTLTVNGTGTFTNLANNGATANRVVVSNNAGQLVPTTFTLPTAGFVENRQHVGGITAPAGQAGGFDLDGTGYLGGSLTTAASVVAGADIQAGANLSAGATLRVGQTALPTGTQAIVSGGDTRIQGNLAVGGVATTTAVPNGIIVRGDIVPEIAANNPLLGNPNVGQSPTNPAGRIWGTLNSLNANIGFPAGAPFASTDAGIDRLTVNGNVIPAFDNASTLGTSSNRWSLVWAANGTISTSDARLKTNITGLGYGLQTVMAMRPVRYAWTKTPTQTNKIGFVAQELQQLVPEVVIVGDDANHTLGVNYAELVPVLVKALQEQQQQLDAMRGRAEKAEAGLQSFEARLRALEASSPTINATALGQR